MFSKKNFNLQKAAKLVASVTGTAVHLTKHTSPLGWAAAAANVVAAVTAEANKAEDPTASWVQLTVEFSDQIREMLTHVGEMEEVLIDTHSVEITTVGEVQIAWRLYSWGLWGPFVPRGQEDAARKLCSSIFWDESSCWRWTQTPMGQQRLVSEAAVSFDSKLSQQLWDSLKPFFDAKVPRALLLHGEVGTGKTAVAHALGRLSGGRVLRIPSRTMHKIGDLSKGLQLMNPTVVLVDDIDRSGDKQGIIDTIGCLRSARLFIATANNANKLDAAVYRRFDVDTPVTVLPEVVEKLLGSEYPEEAKALPAVYLQEFALQRKLSGQSDQEIVSMLIRRRDFAASLTGSGVGDTAVKGEPATPSLD